MAKEEDRSKELMNAAADFFLGPKGETDFDRVLGALFIIGFTFAMLGLIHLL